MPERLCRVLILIQGRVIRPGPSSVCKIRKKERRKEFEVLPSGMIGWVISHLPVEGIKITFRFGSGESISQGHVNYTAVADNLKISLAQLNKGLFCFPT